jgi:large subunit ribosomal protein L29
VNPADLRQMDDAALQEQLTQCHSRWRELRFDDAVGKLTDTAEIRKLKRTIARVHTIITERKMAAAVAAGEPLDMRRRSDRTTPTHRARRRRVGSGRS